MVYRVEIKFMKPPVVAVFFFSPTGGGEGGASFERYLNEKRALIAKGVRIVYIPPHANCSKRCQPYQGKLYSLDGTSGSIEGKSFVPIENAADKVTVTAKSSGKTYNAGLFAFNCRHTMQEYESGMVLEERGGTFFEKKVPKETSHGGVISISKIQAFSPPCL